VPSNLEGLDFGHGFFLSNLGSYHADLANGAVSSQLNVPLRGWGAASNFEDPNGHLLEIITRPYGSGNWNP
jgi:hypothetical protein